MTLPNAGIKWRLGTYRLEISALTCYGQSRRFVVENTGGVQGLTILDILHYIESDLSSLRSAMAEFERQARDSWKEAEK